MVLSILPRFRHLKRCTVSLMQKFPSGHGDLPSYCPVGRVGDPKYRSHPTLEEVQIFSFYRWIWCPNDGWYPVYSRFGADELYTMKFFKVHFMFSFTGIYLNFHL